MTKLSTYLIQLEEFLLANDQKRITHLQNGLSSTEIDSMLLSKGIDAPELRGLYSWKNGLKTENDTLVIEQAELFPDGIMLRLDRCVTVYDLYTQKNKSWRKTLFPFFTNGGGDFYLIDFDARSEFSGMIFYYSPSLLLTQEPLTIFDSLENMFETVLECFTRNAFYLEPEKDWEIDYDLQVQIATKINPRSKFWVTEN